MARVFGLLWYIYADVNHHQNSYDAILLKCKSLLQQCSSRESKLVKCAYMTNSFPRYFKAPYFLVEHLCDGKSLYEARITHQSGETWYYHEQFSLFEKIYNYIKIYSLLYTMSYKLDKCFSCLWLSGKKKPGQINQKKTFSEIKRFLFLHLCSHKHYTFNIRKDNLFLINFLYMSSLFIIPLYQIQDCMKWIIFNILRLD